MQSSETRGSLRVGTVPYMNAKPLVYGLSRIIRGARLIARVPSRLPGMLGRNELDVAIVPVMGYLRSPSLEIIPGACISSRGPVESVRLFYRWSLCGVNRVLLDASSMTSAGLTRIILADRYGLRPEFVSAPPTTRFREVEADAVLLIGDNAMLARALGWRSLDLGAEWQALTGLPFVYAVWAARQGRASGKIVRGLNAVKAHGLAHRDLIARRESRRLGLPVERCQKYLTESILYDLGPEEIAGLGEYRRRAVVHGLVGRQTQIRFARD